MIMKVKKSFGDLKQWQYAKDVKFNPKIYLSLQVQNNGNNNVIASKLQRKKKIELVVAICKCLNALNVCFAGYYGSKL